MNAVEQLHTQLRTALPASKLELRVPRDPRGTWWLDARLGDHSLSIEWSPRHGFGLTASVLGDGYGEGAEEVFATLPEAFERARYLLEHGAYTRPPAKVMLQELRARIGVTQQQLANRLGVQQAAVSRLERRDEISLVSLQRYVEALGGTLDIAFRSPEGKIWPLLPGGVKTAESQSRGNDPSPSVRALVLRCRNLQASKRFYSLLGFVLTQEKHGRGPVHYSFSSSDLLLELYPASEQRPASREVRLTFEVRKLKKCVEQLAAHKLLREATPHLSAGSTYLIRDPDDNLIELKETDDACMALARA